MESLGSTVILLVLLLCVPLCTGAQDAGIDPIAESRRYVQAAQRAFQEKDFVAYAGNLERAVALRPTHPTYLYKLAGAYSLAGRKDAALKTLGRVAAMGLVYPAAKDADFAALANTEEFQRIIRQFDSNRAPLIRSERALTFSGKGLLTESIAIDEASGDYLAGCVYERRILRINHKGEVTEFAGSASGLWGVLGIKIDARSGVLWAASSAVAQMRNSLPEERGRAGLFKFDLKTGRLLGKYLLDNSPDPHLIGDLVMGESGEVYATDSLTPALYRLAPSGDRLEAVLKGRPLVSPQGLDLAPGGARMFISDYSQGVFVYDLKTQRIEAVKIPDDCTLLGTDGLYFHRGSLIAIQNGVNPHRVIRLQLDRNMKAVERWEVLEANHPDFDEPTLGLIAGDDFFYVANSQWGSVDEQGKLAPAEKLRDPVILHLKL